MHQSLTAENLDTQLALLSQWDDCLRHVSKLVRDTRGTLLKGKMDRPIAQLIVTASERIVKVATKGQRLIKFVKIAKHIPEREPTLPNGNQAQLQLHNDIAMITRQQSNYTTHSRSRRYLIKPKNSQTNNYQAAINTQDEKRDIDKMERIGNNRQFESNGDNSNSNVIKRVNLEQTITVSKSIPRAKIRQRQLDFNLASNSSANSNGNGYNDYNYNYNYNYNRGEHIKSCEYFGKQCCSCHLPLKFENSTSLNNGNHAMQEMDNNLFYQLLCCQSIFHLKCLFGIANLRCNKKRRRCPKCLTELDISEQKRIIQLWNKKTKGKNSSKQSATSIDSSIFIFNVVDEKEIKYQYLNENYNCSNYQRMFLNSKILINKLRKDFDHDHDQPTVTSYAFENENSNQNQRKLKSKNKSKTKEKHIHNNINYNELETNTNDKNKDVDGCFNQLFIAVKNNIENYQKGANQINVAFVIDKAMGKSEKEITMEKENQQECLFIVWENECQAAMNKILNQYELTPCQIVRCILGVLIAFKPEAMTFESCLSGM